VKPACVFLVPGDPASPTGGYVYDRRIIEGLRARGWSVALHSPGDGYPAPDAVALAEAERVVGALPDGALVVADGLAFGVLPELVHRHAQRLRWIALVHHPLALETGLAPEVRDALRRSEREALASARGVIVTGPSTARALADYGVPAERIAVVEPGTEPAPLAMGSGGGALQLLCVGTVSARKGQRELIEALAPLADRRWTLHCAGSPDRDPPALAALQAAIARHGLEARVRLHGALDASQLGVLYAQADLFVLPSFHEGYGMALAEALARGLPILSTTAGAIPDTVPPDAGVLVPAGDVPALHAALRQLLDEPARRASLAQGARRAREHLPDWLAAVARFASALERMGRA